MEFDLILKDGRFCTIQYSVDRDDEGYFVDDWAIIELDGEIVGKCDTVEGLSHSQILRIEYECSLHFDKAKFEPQEYHEEPDWFS